MQLKKKILKLLNFFLTIQKNDINQIIINFYNLQFIFIIGSFFTMEYNALNLTFRIW